MNYIKKKMVESQYLYWLQIFSNWLFQGIFHADRTEKTYKILFSLVFWLISFLLMRAVSDYGFYMCLIFGFIVGHSLNWFINCNFFVLLVHRLKWVSISQEKYFKYLFSIQKRIQNKSWVYYCVCMGSICKGELDKSSDIDVTIIRRPGLRNAIASIMFYVYEKKYADFYGVPLDIFISDSPEDNIRKAINQKNPIVIYDPEGNLDKYFPTKQTINDAKILNTVR